MGSGSSNPRETWLVPGTNKKGETIENKEKKGGSGNFANHGPWQGATGAERARKLVSKVGANSTEEIRTREPLFKGT